MITSDQVWKSSWPSRQPPQTASHASKPFAAARHARVRERRLGPAHARGRDRWHARPGRRRRRSARRAVFCRGRALKNARGRVIVTGIGKCGHVGQKIAATFASTGTPAFFVHPSEASHGDLGMITRDDVILALSWSGETVELKNIITYSRRFAVPLIAITSRAEFGARPQADVVLELPRPRKPARTASRRPPRRRCSWRSATASPSRCSRRKGFTAHDFKVFHPGGSLGASLKFVADVMHKGERLPLAPRGRADERGARDHDAARASAASASSTRRASSSASSPTATCAVTWAPTCSQRDAGDIMTRKPKTIAPDMLASAALEVINAVAHHGAVRRRQGQAGRHRARSRPAAQGVV